MASEARRKALIIAVSEYDDEEHLGSLEFCKNDGEKMYELLRSLNYEISEDHKLIGYVEYGRIRDAIYSFFDNRKTSADDTLLFYYSGHGIPISEGDTCLASSETDYYSPRERGFPSYELTNLVNDSNSIRIVEVLDCCYSGAARIGKGGVGFEDAAILGTAAIENNARRLRQGEGKCLLAASQATEEAYGNEGHSIFTHFLLRGLRGTAESVDSEGNVTPETLGNYVYREIINLPLDIRPKQKPIRKTEASGEIILAEYPTLMAAKVEDKLASLTKLLIHGNIEEFNKKRDQIPAYLLNFSQVDLRGKNLSKVNLSGTTLSKADLSNTILEGVNLSNANLIMAKLEGAYLQEADLTKADLNLANLSNADLSKANLSSADLSHADLSGTNLFFTYFKDTKVINTKFFGSDTSKAIIKGSLEGAIFESKIQNDKSSASINPSLETQTQTQNQPSGAPFKAPSKKYNERAYNESSPVKRSGYHVYVLIAIAAVIAIIVLAHFFVTGNTTNSNTTFQSTRQSHPNTSSMGQPFAYGQYLTTTENTSKTFTLKGNETGQIPIRFSISNNPGHGTLTFDPKTGKITYTPNPGFVGSDSFGFLVTDSHNMTSNIGNVSINVSSSPSATTPTPLSFVTAYDKNLNMTENSQITFTLKGTDTGQIPIMFSIIDNPQNGNLTSLNPKTGEITYTPNSGFVGTDRFGFLVTDNDNNTSNTGIISINVSSQSLTSSSIVSSIYDNGTALDNLGDFAQAIQAYDKVLAIDPNYIHALDNKRRDLEYLGYGTQGIQYYKKALSVNPNDVYTLDLLSSDLAANLGDITGAKKYAKQALAIDPEDSTALAIERLPQPNK